MSTLTLSFKGMTLKVIPLKKGEMIIGSDPGCAVHIDSLAVQPRHAEVVTRETSTLVRDLGSADGTFVNNDKIAERELKDGDEIRVGKHTLTFMHGAVAGADAPAVIPSPSVKIEEFTAHAQPRTAWLQILSGHNLGKTISLNRALTNLGTPGVQTAVIAKRNEGYFLSHLEGEHVPKVGDVPIGDKSRQLQDGDIIQIGNVKMQFYFQ